MALVTGTGLNLVDIAVQGGLEYKPDLRIAEILTTTNDIIDDMPWVECNDGTKNRTAVRNGLPKGTFRKLYGGVKIEKSGYTQVQDSCGMLETYTRTDAKLLKIANKKEQVLMNELRGAVAGLGNTFAQTLFYGDTKLNPEQFMGFSPRYNSYGTDEKKSSFNVLNAGGTGSKNTSIYVVAWGEGKVHGLYPQGCRPGIQKEDLGPKTVNPKDDLDSVYQVVEQHYEWDCGLAVPDWRYVVRIANIDTTKLADAGLDSYAGTNLIKYLMDAIYRLPADAQNVKIYGNRLVAAALSNIALTKTNLALGIDEYCGKKITHFQGHPVRRCDALLNTEAQVMADA